MHSYVLFWISYLLFANDFFVTHGLGPVTPGRRAAKRITSPYVENNYRIEVKIKFMLIAYVVLLCEFLWEFSIFHFLDLRSIFTGTRFVQRMWQPHELTQVNFGGLCFAWTSSVRCVHVLFSMQIFHTFEEDADSLT